MSLSTVLGLHLYVNPGLTLDVKHAAPHQTCYKVQFWIASKPLKCTCWAHVIWVVAAETMNFH